MRFRLATLAAILATGMSLAPRGAAAADKATLACIQSAEEGERARKAGELLHARELFAQCSAHECPTMLRKDCSSWLEDADRQVPSIVLGAHDGEGRDVVDARVSVDGALVREQLDGNPIALDPGSHVVRFERVGVAPVEVHVVLRAGEKNRPVLATLAPPAPAVPIPPAAGTTTPGPAAPPAPAGQGGHVPAGAWVLGGVAVAAFGVFGVLGSIGQNDANTLRGTCAPGCTDSQVQSVHLKLIGADVGLGVGVLSLAGAVWIAIRGLTRSPTQAATGTTTWQLVLQPSQNAMRGGLFVRF
jgi:hypothetical protein